MKGRGGFKEGSSQNTPRENVLEKGMRQEGAVLRKEGAVLRKAQETTHRHGESAREA